MFELKKIHPDAIAQALERAHFYRLLNEPRLAQSICLDILEADPDNDKAIITLLLAITDEFSSSSSAEMHKAQQLLPRLQNDYEKNCKRTGNSSYRFFEFGNFIKGLEL
jgi:hypothetical protein